MLHDIQGSIPDVSASFVPVAVPDPAFRSTVATSNTIAPSLTPLMVLVIDAPLFCVVPANVASGRIEPPP